MSDISKIKIDDETYTIKDLELRRRLELLLGPLPSEENESEDQNVTKEEN